MKFIADFKFIYRISLARFYGEKSNLEVLQLQLYAPFPRNRETKNSKTWAIWHHPLSILDLKLKKNK